MKISATVIFTVKKYWRLSRLIILISFLFLQSYESMAQWELLGNSLFPPNNLYVGYGNNLTMNQTGDHIVFSSTNVDSFQYEIRIFQYTGSQWQLKGDFITAEFFPTSLYIHPDGDRVIVGISTYEVNQEERGAVAVYDWNNGNWNLLTTLTGESTEERFGDRIAYDEVNDRIFASAPNFTGTGDQNGRVSIFQWNGSQYAKINELFGILGDSFGRHGLEISLDGSTLAISAVDSNVGANISAGEVFIYERDGINYLPKGTPIPGSTQFSQFGFRIGLSEDGNTLAASSNVPPNDNMVQIYDWNGSIWFQRGQAIPSEAAQDQIGTIDLSNNGNIVAIGGPRNDGAGQDAGHVRVFGWEGNNWDQIGFDIEGETGDYFGEVVSISDAANRVAIFASQNSQSGAPRGYVSVYENPILAISKLNAPISTIAPNPAASVTTLKLDKPYETISISIYNAMGKLIATYQHSNTDMMTLELPNMAGIYFLKISIDDRYQATQSIIKYHEK